MPSPVMPGGSDIALWTSGSSSGESDDHEGLARCMPRCGDVVLEVKTLGIDGSKDGRADSQSAHCIACSTLCRGLLLIVNDSCASSGRRWGTARVQVLT